MKPLNCNVNLECYLKRKRRRQSEWEAERGREGGRKYHSVRIVSSNHTGIYSKLKIKKKKRHPCLFQINKYFTKIYNTQVQDLYICICTHTYVYIHIFRLKQISCSMEFFNLVFSFHYLFHRPRYWR